MVLAMSFGSIGYGYSASIIGTTLGKITPVRKSLNIKPDPKPSPTVLHQVFRARHPVRRHFPDFYNECEVPGYTSWMLPELTACRVCIRSEASWQHSRSAT